MFFCKPCADENGWPFGYGSFGECEICRCRTHCADIPSHMLKKVGKSRTELLYVEAFPMMKQLGAFLELFGIKHQKMDQIPAYQYATRLEAEGPVPWHPIADVTEHTVEFQAPGGIGETMQEAVVDFTVNFMKMWAPVDGRHRPADILAWRVAPKLTIERHFETERITYLIHARVAVVVLPAREAATI